MTDRDLFIVEPPLPSCAQQQTSDNQLGTRSFDGIWLVLGIRWTTATATHSITSFHLGGCSHCGQVLNVNGYREEMVCIAFLCLKKPN